MYLLYGILGSGVLLYLGECTLLVNFLVVDSDFSFLPVSKQFPDERPADEVFDTRTMIPLMITKMPTQTALSVVDF